MKTRYEDFIGLKNHLKDVFGIDLLYTHINDYLRNCPTPNDIKPLTLEEEAQLDYETYSDDCFDATGEFPTPLKLPEVDPTKVKKGVEGVNSPPLRKPPKPTTLTSIPPPPEDRMRKDGGKVKPPPQPKARRIKEFPDYPKPIPSEG